MLYNLFENRDFVSVFAVALLAEGVDRNVVRVVYGRVCIASPSSRRAWIEIFLVGCLPAPPPVALLAEGVDRNKIALTDERNIMRSPSSRRAWIEIRPQCRFCCLWWSPSSRRAWIEIVSRFWRSSATAVALLAEGVDRNSACVRAAFSASSRPPRGGRG